MASRVLVTRAPHQASELADRLRVLGAEPILVPTIEIAEPKSFAALDHALANLGTFHWLVFTSANAVSAFRTRQSFVGEGLQPRRLESSKREGALAPEGMLRIAAIGASTARALEAVGLRADLIPAQAVAESLAEALLPHARQPNGEPTRFLLVRAEQARDYLPEALTAAGSHVTIAPAYRTVMPPLSVDALRELFRDPTQYPDAITFTSASSVLNLFDLLAASSITLPTEPVRASIGPITSKTLADLGYPADVEAPTATVAALAEALIAHLG